MSNDAIATPSEVERHKSETLMILSRDFRMMAPPLSSLMGEFYDRALADNAGMLLVSGPGMAARKVLAFALPEMATAYLAASRPLASHNEQGEENPPVTPPALPAEEPAAPAEATPPPSDAVTPQDNPPGDIQSSAAPAPVSRWASIAAAGK